MKNILKLWTFKMVRKIAITKILYKYRRLQRKKE